MSQGRLLFQERMQSNFRSVESSGWQNPLMAESKKNFKGKMPDCKKGKSTGHIKKPLYEPIAGANTAVRLFHSSVSDPILFLYCIFDFLLLLKMQSCLSCFLDIYQVDLNI